MPDNHSKEVRSMNMSHIRSTNSKPEEIVRKYLFSKGLRYRINVRNMPGKPDIVLKKYKTVKFTVMLNVTETILHSSKLKDGGFLRFGNVS